MVMNVSPPFSFTRSISLNVSIKCSIFSHSHSKSSVLSVLHFNIFSIYSLYCWNNYFDFIANWMDYIVISDSRSLCFPEETLFFFDFQRYNTKQQIVIKTDDKIVPSSPILDHNRNFLLLNSQF